MNPEFIVKTQLFLIKSFSTISHIRKMKDPTSMKQPVEEFLNSVTGERKDLLLELQVLIRTLYHRRDV
jgi:hypothetical protein